MRVHVHVCVCVSKCVSIIKHILVSLVNFLVTLYILLWSLSKLPLVRHAFHMPWYPKVALELMPLKS